MSMHLTKLAFLMAGGLALAGCDNVAMPGFLQGQGGGASGASARQVERDVEAPEVFQVADRGLWDGRPSLGGVWVAHADALDPERVIIRNEDNGEFVIGVLYRPERQSPGPAFQVSSDAADELGMLAGQPANLTVTALRQQSVSEGPAPSTETQDLTAPDDISATSLDPIAAAGAALDTAPSDAPASAATAPAPRPAAAASAPAAAPAASALERPYIQIGIFSVEANADNTAEAMRQAGMVPTIKPGNSNGKDFWRVIVGPAGSTSERAALLETIRGLGFSDAYFVTN